MSRLYLKYFLKRFLETVLALVVAALYREVFATFFGHYKFWTFIFFSPVAYYLLFVIYRAFNLRRFARYIENHNDLKEYLVSFVELKNSDNEFVPLVKNRLFEILKRQKIRIPFNAPLLRFLYFAVLFLGIFVIGFSYAFSPKDKSVEFDRTEYNAFPGEYITLSLKGISIPDSISLYLKNRKTIKVAVSGKKVRLRAPLDTGRFLLSCSFCTPARLNVISKPYVKAEGYVIMPIARRELLPVDYVLSTSKLRVRLSFWNTDSSILELPEKKVYVYGDTVVEFSVKNSGKVRALLFRDGMFIDTVLYRIFAVKDMPPKVVVLYPEKSINPVMEDTVKIVAYIYDDIGLDRAFALLYREGYKTLIYEKKYKDKLSDTLRLDIPDILRGYDEVKLKLVALDISGKEGFAELTYKKPTYEERLREFMAIADSIKSSESSIAGEGEIERLDLSLKEKRELNLEEREKLKMSLEESFKEMQKAEKQLKEVEKIVKNLKELSQDRELVKTMEEFTRTFSEILEEHFRDILKKLLEGKNKIDTMNRKDLQAYMEQLKSRRNEIIRELKKLKEFMELVKKELNMEEFVTRFEKLSESEKYLQNKTKYFEDIKPLEKEQMDLLKKLDSLKNLSPELWRKYRDEFKAVKSQMQEVAQKLKNGDRKSALNKEGKILKSMERLAKNLRKDILKHREKRKRASLEKIERIKNELLFMNLVTGPEMDLHTRGLYGESLKLVLRYADSLDAITYVRIFKSIALLRLASGFVKDRPALAYGLVNQALYHLLRKQIGMKKSGARGTGEELREMLKKLLQQQSGLTQETKGLLPLPLPSQGNLESLLREYGTIQERLRKMAEQIAKLAEDQKTKGELDRALAEMKKAENELKRGRLSSETVKHQRKALRHLLNAYRSIRKKDVSRKRVSKPGEAFIPDIPPVPENLIINEKIRILLKEMTVQGKVHEPFLKDYIENLRKIEENP